MFSIILTHSCNKRSRKLKALPTVHSTLSKGQPEDGPTNWAATCRWNYNLFK
jgi:hypothetical protein